MQSVNCGIFQITLINCVELIELANRLCLPRLVTLVEVEVIKQATEVFNNSQLTISSKKAGADGANGHGSSVGYDLTEEALAIVQSCQVSLIIPRKVRSQGHVHTTQPTCSSGMYL